MLAARCDPSDEADESNNTDSGTGIIHRIFGNGMDAWEVERNRSEEQKQQSDDVQGDGDRRRERIRAVEFDYMAREVPGQAANQGQGVRKI